MSEQSKYLIVNADDFGLSREVNHGIIETMEQGIVTSASLMVRQPAAKEAAEYAKQNRNVSIGLHLDLGEWAYRDGDWFQLYEVVPTDSPALVEKEVRFQLAEFRRLVGRTPSHLDSHQHVHRKDPVRCSMLKLASDLNVPLRDMTPGIRYCGDFYGQDAEAQPIPNALTVENLQTIISTLQPGTTELGCHPGYTTDLQSPYRQERESEVAVLCDPELRAFLAEQKVQLCSFPLNGVR